VKATPEQAGSRAAEPPGRARRYRWLLFDADGTLFDYDRAEAAALQQTFEQIGAPFRPEHLTEYRQINQSLWHAVERGDLAPEILKVQRFELMLAAVNVTHPPADFSERYLGCLAECSQLVDGAEEVVRQLRQNHQLAIVTNGLQKVQRGRLARSTVRDCFAHLIISEEIGCAKPAKEFFDVAFERLGQPQRNEVLMVGDNWNSDITGAARYGLDTCWFNPARLPRPATPEITVEITEWGELATFLRRGNSAPG